MDEERLIRRRQADAAEAIDRRRTGPSPGGPAFAGRVVNAGAMPNRVPGYYALQPQRIGGTEAEGSAVSATDLGKPAIVLVVGQRVPSVGDKLIARAIEGRWVAETKQSGGGGINIGGCTCSGMPSTLAVTVTNSSLSFGILQSCTLQYGPTPAWAANMSLGASCYLSTSTFVDQTMPEQFYYYFACLGGYYILTRVYQTSVYGSPYRDTVRYKWLVGNTGNVCKPFGLRNGQIYPGGNAACTAEVS